jgi:hypothetical protein
MMSSHINLMTPRAQLRECSRTRLRQWSRILMLAICLLMLHALVSWWPIHVRSSQRAALEAQYEPVRQVKLENNLLEQRIDDTRTDDQLELTLARQTPVVTLVGLVSRAVGQSQGKVFLDKLAYTQSDPNHPAHANASVVELEGIGADPVAIGEFADRLKTSLDFADVQVGTVEAVEINKHRMQTFKIRLSF